MFSDLFDIKAVAEQDDFGVKQYKSAIYRGQIDAKTSKRHGLGVQTYVSGRVYEGSWHEDKRQGKGYEIF